MTPDEALRALERAAVAGGDVEAGVALRAARRRAGLCALHGEPELACRRCESLTRGIDWSLVFRNAAGAREPGASIAQLRALQEDLVRPLDDAELARLAAGRRRAGGEGIVELDPRSWKLPPYPLPRTYLSLLAWSNGGTFVRGARELGFVPAGEVRRLLLDHAVPAWMPGAVPFASDGAGRLYLFDLRAPPSGGEHPVLLVGAGALSYDPAVCRPVASSFLVACLGGTDPFGAGRSDRSERVDVWLVARPAGGARGLVALKTALELTGPIAELKRASDALPARLLRAADYFPTAMRCAHLNARDPCLEVREVDASTAIDVTHLR